MSYLSDTSSTCSAPPLTPSPHQTLSPPSASHSHHADFSSPTTYTLVSPPDSLRRYSSALKQRMTAGLTAAMKDLKDDRGGPERKFDVEYGYDENPIDRHVMLHLTPRTVPEKPKAVPELGLLPLPNTAATQAAMSSLEKKKSKKTKREREIVRLHQVRVIESQSEQDVFDDGRFEDAEENDEEMLACSSSPAEADGDDDDLIDQDPVPMRYRPGLIHFHRSNSSTLTRPSYSRMNSNVSTTSNVSMPSEASFEAVRAEDIVSMYGGANSCEDMDEDMKCIEVEDEQLEEYQGRASMESTDTRETLRPYSSYTETLHVISNRSSSSPLTYVPAPVPIAITAPAPVYSALPSPPPPPQQQQQQREPPHLHSRPSLLRPRPRHSAHPYDTDGRSLSEDGGAEPEWLAGRTVSERMVAQAGLRCQRQRVGTVRAGVGR
ncbi:hypothetical protein IAR55_006591 [Kwoniella newhampshirensis]|uniref:Uncharacterized protein n=1 Tax=Kwoniella newhampshirensis TaxID=1651941 RepID=A0AAW0YU65_9TREE